MAHLISEKIVTARKVHDCMAYEWIVNSDWDSGIFTFSELRAIVRMNNQRGKILPGQKYLRQTVLFEGKPETFKADPDMHKICLKFDVYED